MFKFSKIQTEVSLMNTCLNPPKLKHELELKFKLFLLKITKVAKNLPKEPKFMTLFPPLTAPLKKS